MLGVALLQRMHSSDTLWQTRSGVVCIGVIVAVFSLAPSLWIAFLGAVAFGAAAAFTLAAGMGTLQSQLDGPTVCSRSPPST